MKLLCLGAHSDDIEVGCGGTVLRLVEEARLAEVRWVVFAASGERELEARSSAERFLAKAPAREIVTKQFRDGFFPYGGAEIKDCFEEIKRSYEPDLILTHFRGDLHQDHRLVSELTWNTFRNHLIMEYEILKYDGDLGAPNGFVHIGERTGHEKVRIIMESFRSQKHKHWFTEDAFLALLRLRGIESHAPEKYAEGFYCRKLVF
jgi:LmbE family N-acetylglucosaminyl deacetylase